MPAPLSIHLPVNSLRNIMKFPIYLLVDTSYSMLGEAVTSLKVALENIVSAIRSDAQLSNAAQISIHTFDNDVIEMCPMTPVAEIDLSSIDLQSRGHESNIGKALKLICTRLTQVKDDSENHPCMLVVMTDGHPSDLILYDEMTEQLKQYEFATIITCMAGHQSDPGFMRLLSSQIYRLDEADINTFSHAIESAFYGYQQGEDGKLSDDLPSEIIIH